MAANESKERILAGAKELFLARGYAATTVDAICEKAELTKGSFYYFFDSKEDLGLAVRRRGRCHCGAQPSTPFRSPLRRGTFRSPLLRGSGGEG